MNRYQVIYVYIKVKFLELLELFLESIELYDVYHTWF